jgi:hypothetical protein
LSPNRVANPKKIIQVVAEFYDLKERDILLKRGYREPNTVNFNK